MAGPDRSASDALMQRLTSEPFIFDFFMALRRLENTRPDLPRIGHSRRLADDPIRFGQEPSLAFAPSALSKMLPPAGVSGRPPRLLLTFFGLLGANGPLPHHLTEHARDRERQHADPTFSRFLDLFHHRLVSLFYRAWAVNNKAVQYERAAPAAATSPAAADDQTADRFFMYVASLFGIGMPSMLGRDRVPDVAKAHYSGRLVAQNRGAEGLAAIVGDYFGVPCEVLQFVGQWMPLPADCLCKLGASPRTGTLGSTLIVGSRIWEAQQKFRIVVGPVALKDYERLLPSGGSLSRLIDWAALYSGAELSWDLNLILKRDEVPQTQLGRYGRLGWTSWTRSRPHTRDADDLVLIPPTS